MFEKYFKSLYSRTMHEAYSLAYTKIMYALQDGGKCLDCGANNGYMCEFLRRHVGLDQQLYHGIEWNDDLVIGISELDQQHIKLVDIVSYY